MPRTTDQSAAVLDEVRALQLAAGVDCSEHHPYLTTFARVKHAEHQLQRQQRLVAGLRRELAALPEPRLKVRIYHLANDRAALEPFDLSSQWAGAFANECGAVLVLGSDQPR